MTHYIEKITQAIAQAKQVENPPKGLLLAVANAERFLKVGVSYSNEDFDICSLICGEVRKVGGMV